MFLRPVRNCCSYMGFNQLHSTFLRSRGQVIGILLVISSRERNQTQTTDRRSCWNTQPCMIVRNVAPIDLFFTHT